jgi:glycosyltransferase involved in cell wall biosynthesis
MTAPRLRFAHVFATFGRGGPQVRAVQLLHHLGGDVEHVVMAMDGDTGARALLGDNVAVAFVEPPPVRGYLAVRKAQRAWLAAQHPDLVLTYNWGAIETVAAARRLGLPLVHHEDGFGPEETERRLLRRSWLRRWLLRSVPVIVPSAVLRRIACDEWRLRERDVHHLVNGVDLARFAPRADAAAAGGPVVLGSVGGLRAEKDHATLLRAAARLGDGVRVCLVGAGPVEAELRAEAARLGLGERVTFAGQTDDTAPWYQRFDVFVLSSRTEQMPIAMLEAMASGLPVVATDVGDVRAILPADAGGCVVPPGDPDALAAALARVVGDAALRVRLGAANRRVVEERYESALCLERFAQLYRSAM